MYAILQLHVCADMSILTSLCQCSDWSLEGDKHQFMVSTDKTVPKRTQKVQIQGFRLKS